MKYVQISIIIAVISIFYNCNSTKNIIPNDYKGKQIIFGYGGGFTGEIKEYILLDNGNLYLNNANTKEIKLIKLVDKKKTKELFLTLANLMLEKYEFKHPFNNYKFLKLKKGISTIEIIWGNPKYQPKKEISDFYNSLFLIIN